MKRIEHLEDLAFKLPKEDLIELTSALLFAVNGNNIGQLSVKMDGAPAIVFGKDDKGFLLSTKSYFNKTPVMYRSMQEIENSGRDPVLIQKLRFYWSKFKTQCMKEYPDNTVYLADVIIDPWAKISHKRTRPNIIEYQGLPDVDFLLATHTIIENGIEKGGEPDYIPLLLPAISCLISPYQFKSSPTLSFWLGRLGLLEDRLFLASDTKNYDYCKTQINNVIRDPYCKRGWIRQIPEYINGSIRTHNFKILHDMKQSVILPILNSRYKSYETFIEDEPCNDEGYVFRYKDYVVKLVDRYEFSRRNFDQSTERGWKRESK